MIEACRFAGVQEIELLREPKAALMAFGTNHAQAQSEIFSIVIRLGGTSYEVSLVRTKAYNSKIVDSEVNLQLGGRHIEDGLTKLAISAKLPQANDAQPSQKFKLQQKICQAKQELFDRRAQQVDVSISSADLEELIDNPASFA